MNISTGGVTYRIETDAELEAWIASTDVTLAAFLAKLPQVAHRVTVEAA